jgi:hypothetical protein
MTAELTADTTTGETERYEFTGVGQVVLEREGDKVWSLFIDGATIRIHMPSISSVDCVLIGLPNMRTPEDTLPAEQAVKDGGS